MGIGWDTALNVATGGLYGTGKKLFSGDWKGALKNQFTGGLYGAGQDVYDTGRDIYNKAKDAINAPYEEAREGFDTILGQLERFKQERLKRKDDLYSRANTQFDDTRRAMAMAYGDPTTWRL